MTDEEFEAKVKSLTFWSGKNSMTLEDMATIQPGLARLMPEVGARTWKLYYAAKALAAPFTINTMPEATLKALADHGEIGALLPTDGGDCEEVLAAFARAGVDVEVLAAQLQDEGARSFVKSWKELLECIASKSKQLETAG